MADVAYLLKNIRVQLIRSDIFFLSKQIVEENGLPTDIVKLEYIDATLKLDKENELKVAPHMLDIHLSDDHFTKMKMSIAVQFFREASVAIRYRVIQGQLPAQAETTAWFFDEEQLADLFSEGARAPSEEPEAPEEIMNWVLSMLSKVEKDILANVGGFLLRAVLKFVNCNTCKEALK
ncbi:hypothetical protein HPB47_007804 [Ixodes persulcatus]|uniref:Uncharacterized protein n=1 Tax=Ixodes persulcatus TaxID=34615 RepID=A0AC60P6I0_IXOPE|nr:hypothetical protein HPB47_007804 [Ixodes persulcatus]